MDLSKVFRASVLFLLPSQHALNPNIESPYRTLELNENLYATDKAAGIAWLKRPSVGGVVEVRRAQVSSSSLDRRSKLRDPSPKSPGIVEQCNVNIPSLTDQRDAIASGHGHRLVAGVS
ncbi:hypothetical protein TNCV_602051 [Trichonephila clavipes]|nr:hypothetical protein TNCV_602051 [Trichonephila clavipes]